MIKLQVQGHNDCFLAVVAMLRYDTIENVRFWAHELTGKEKWEGNSIPDFLKVMDFFDLPYDMIDLDKLAATKSAGQPDLTGRGSILICFYGQEETHIVAFEDGVIFEPNGFVFSWTDLLQYWADRNMPIKSFTVTKL